MSALQPSACHADKMLLCQIPLGLKLRSLTLGQKKVYSSTTVVVEGFMEGLINTCSWGVKQGRICHSGCHCIWDRWGLLSSNPHIQEKGEVCLEAGCAWLGGEGGDGTGHDREKQNCFLKIKISFAMSRAVWGTSLLHSPKRGEGKYLIFWMLQLVGSRLGKRDCGKASDAWRGGEGKGCSPSQNVAMSLSGRCCSKAGIFCLCVL